MSFRRRSREKRVETAGTRKTATRKKQTTKRQHERVGHSQPVAAERSAAAKSHDYTTVRSSSRKRAAKKNATAALKPKPRVAITSIVDPNGPDEVYGAQLSERKRRGESRPRLHEKKTRNTRSIEAKRAPRTGLTKSRSISKK